MLSGEHVLVAEDECVIALDLTDMLESAGATVIGPAATVREALRLAMSEAVDRALLDFNLADDEVTPGLELLAANFTASQRLVFGRLSGGIEGGPCPVRKARRWLPMTAVKCGLPPMLRRWSTSSATPTAPHPCATTARVCSCRPGARASSR